VSLLLLVWLSTISGAKDGWVEGQMEHVAYNYGNPPAVPKVSAF
jgi:hypothetical protein